MIGRNRQRNKDYRWRCRDCKGMYTVRTKTVFEESRLPLRVWVYAIWRAASRKKGYSALQPSREMEITHKSALSFSAEFVTMSVTNQLRRSRARSRPMKFTSADGPAIPASTRKIAT